MAMDSNGSTRQATLRLLTKEEIERSLGKGVDMVVDGGILLPVPSTVVDLSGSEPELVRAGKGDVDTLELFR